MVPLLLERKRQNASEDKGWEQGRGRSVLSAFAPASHVVRTDFFLFSGPSCRSAGYQTHEMPSLSTPERFTISLIDAKS